MKKISPNVPTEIYQMFKSEATLNFENVNQAISKAMRLYIKVSQETRNIKNKKENDA